MLAEPHALPRHNKKNENKMERKIICRNVGVCTKAGKVQIITDDDAELKCPECGSEDVELVKDVPTNPGNKKKIIAIIAAAIIVLGGGGIGIFKACQGGTPTESAPQGGTPKEPVSHSTKIADVTTDANWTLETNVGTLNPNDTIWIKANENISKEEQDKGVMPQITLVDSTSTFVLSAETVTDNANVQVKTVDGKSDTYFIALHKKDFVKPGGNTEGDGAQPPITNSVFGGRAKYDKAAGVITFTGTVTISLHDEDDNTLTFRRGDKIRGAKVSGGRLVGGEAVIDGESQLLSGISERL